MSGLRFSDLQGIIAREFAIPSDSVDIGTTADDIDGWDSIAHTSLIMAIEKFYHIRFENEEVYEFSNVGVLFGRIQELMSTN